MEKCKPSTDSNAYFSNRLDAVRFVENAIRFDIENGTVGSVWTIQHAGPGLYICRKDWCYAN